MVLTLEGKARISTGLLAEEAGRKEQ